MATGILRGRPVLAGEAEGPCLVLRAPLSLWGGVDPASGRIVDRHHPDHGRCIAGQVLALVSGRGSSSSSSVLLELLQQGTAPAALLLGRLDPILALGVVVAEEVFGWRLPTLVVGTRALARLRAATRVRVHADGRLLLWETAHPIRPVTPD